MSSKGYATPLRLEPRPSPPLLCGLMGLHGLALGSLVLSPIPPWLYPLCALALSLHCGWALARHFGPTAIVSLLWDGDGVWHLTLKDGRTLEAELHGQSYFSGYLTVLLFRNGTWRTRSLILPRGTLPREVLRRLRVRMCLERSALSGHHKSFTGL